MTRYDRQYHVVIAEVAGHLIGNQVVPFAACDTGDVETVAACFTTNAVHYAPPGYGGPARGGQAIGEVIARLVRATASRWSNASQPPKGLHGPPLTRTAPDGGAPGSAQISIRNTHPL
jgi:hypothetical protein